MKKFLDSINNPTTICAALSGICFLISPTLFSGYCFGVCSGVFIINTMNNYYK